MQLAYPQIIWSLFFLTGIFSGWDVYPLLFLTLFRSFFLGGVMFFLIPSYLYSAPVLSKRQPSLKPLSLLNSEWHSGSIGDVNVIDTNLIPRRLYWLLSIYGKLRSTYKSVSRGRHGCCGRSPRQLWARIHIHARRTSKQVRAGTQGATGIHNRERPHVRARI